MAQAAGVAAAKIGALIGVFVVLLTALAVLATFLFFDGMSKGQPLLDPDPR